MMFLIGIFWCFSLAISIPLIKNKTCEGIECKQTISMPLVDGMKATLKADLDVTEMNTFLKYYIKQEVQREVKQALANEMAEFTKSVETVENMLLSNNKTTEEIMSKSDTVVLTTCTSYGTIKSLVMLNFSDIHTVYGIDNVQLVRETGQFTCEHEGLYLISIYVMSEISGATLQLEKNGLTVGIGRYPKQSNGWHTSTIILFERLTVGDRIGASLYAEQRVFLSAFGYKQSCLSILKV